MRRGVESAGFTLIELVVAVTILGILAAFAVPRFASLEQQARTASRDALAGSVRSTAALAHALWLANGGRDAEVLLDGQPIAIANGYPTAGGIGSVVAGYPDFGFAAADTVTRLAHSSVGTCAVVYAEAAPDRAPAVRVTGPC